MDCENEVNYTWTNGYDGFDTIIAEYAPLLQDALASAWLKINKK